MPDITMCKDVGCPKKWECRRFTDRPDPKRQSYFAESPREEKYGRFICEFEWPIEKVAKEKKVA